MFTVYGSACQQLERDHAALLAADRENSRVLNNRQAVSPLGTCSFTRQQTYYYAHLILPVNFLHPCPTEAWHGCTLKQLLSTAEICISPNMTQLLH